MTKKYVQLLALMIMFVTIFKCSDSSTDANGNGNGNQNGNPPGNSGKVNMTINGTAWESSNANAAAIMSGALVTSLGIGGTRNPNFDTMSFAVADLSGVKVATYNQVSATGTAISATYINPADSLLNSTIDPTKSQVEITITSLDLTKNLVSGTFSFDLYRLTGGQLVEIRNGSFTNIPIFTNSGK